MAAQLQVKWDEVEALEREVERLWPDPIALSEELETGARDLARLKAEIRELDGPMRHRASLLVTSMAMAGMAALGIAAWLMQGGL
jgi:hypothetical protein